MAADRLADGACGLLIRLHHVIADGIAPMAILGALFDPGSGIPVPEAPGWAPAPKSAVRELAADQLRRQALPLTRALSRCGVRPA
jgi:hypothetical protein